MANGPLFTKTFRTPSRPEPPHAGRTVDLRAEPYVGFSVKTYLGGVRVYILVLRKLREPFSWLGARILLGHSLNRV